MGCGIGVIEIGPGLTGLNITPLKWLFHGQQRECTYVRLRSVSFSQICVQSLRHTQIHVLPKPCPLKSVSSDVTPRSMSFQKHISSDLCPLTSYSDLCPPKYMFPQICVLWHNTQIKVICQKKYPHRSVSSTFWTEKKKTFTGIAINSRIHIWDTYWFVPVWYQLISCIIYPFMLCMFFFSF